MTIPRQAYVPNALLDSHSRFNFYSYYVPFVLLLQDILHNELLGYSQRSLIVGPAGIVLFRSLPLVVTVIS